MRVNVSQLLKEPIGARRHYDFQEEAEGGSVTCAADLLRTDAGILVSASCAVRPRNICGRCLTSFVDGARFHFDEEFFPVVDGFTGARLPVREDGDFTIGADNVLDLDEAARQYTLLALPIKALCREDCRGLCPQCGANLNEGSCPCPSVPSHPSWEALRQTWAARTR